MIVFGVVVSTRLIGVAPSIVAPSPSAALIRSSSVDPARGAATTVSGGFCCGGGDAILATGPGSWTGCCTATGGDLDDTAFANAAPPPLPLPPPPLPSPPSLSPSLPEDERSSIKSSSPSSSPSPSPPSSVSPPSPLLTPPSSSLKLLLPCPDSVDSSPAACTSPPPGAFADSLARGATLSPRSRASRRATARSWLVAWRARFLDWRVLPSRPGRARTWS